MHMEELAMKELYFTHVFRSPLAGRAKVVTSRFIHRDDVTKEIMQQVRGRHPSEWTEFDKLVARGDLKNLTMDMCATASNEKDAANNFLRYSKLYRTHSKISGYDFNAPERRLAPVPKPREPKKTYVVLLTSKTTKRTFVSATKTPTTIQHVLDANARRRVRQYRDDTVYNDIIKYGIEDFVIEIVGAFISSKVAKQARMLAIDALTRKQLNYSQNKR